MNGVGFLFFLLTLAGFLWYAANAFEAWRYLRTRRQAPKFRGLRLVISNNNRERKRA